MPNKTTTCQVLEDLSFKETPITPEQYNAILDIQQNILQMMAEGGKSTDILSSLCNMAEKLLPNSVASIMMLNEQSKQMSVLTAPSIPKVGHDALANLTPGVGGGSCGNAVFRNEPQYVYNTFQDPRWTDLRHIAYDFNLCSCWSMPIRNAHNEAVGSFALSSFEHRTPAAFHRTLLATAASIVNIVQHNEYTEKRVQLFSTAMQNASEGMIIIDEHNHIIEVNRAFEEIYGYLEADILNQDPSILASGLYDNHFYKTMWDEIQNHAKWSGEIINKRADGSNITEWMSISALRDENKEIHHYLAIFSDLTPLKASQERVEYMAYHDSITALHNKTHLEQQLNHADAKHLLLLNVDNFSYIN
jgi:PAS domain S-box-containing protein